MRSVTLSLVIAALVSVSTTAWACPRCRPFVNAGVYNPQFGSHLLTLLLPVILLLGIGLGCYFIDALPKALRGEAHAPRR